MVLHFPKRRREVMRMFKTWAMILTSLLSCKPGRFAGMESTVSLPRVSWEINRKWAFHNFFPRMAKKLLGYPEFETWYEWWTWWTNLLQYKHHVWQGHARAHHGRFEGILARGLQFLELIRARLGLSVGPEVHLREGVDKIWIVHRGQLWRRERAGLFHSGYFKQ